jgi:hypothetical protein
MAIQISGTTVIDNGRNISAGIGTFTSVNVPPAPLTFSPANGATGVAVNNTNISITFNQQVLKGTGSITLRSGSASGTVIETIAVSSGLVTISGATVTINPTETSFNYYNQTIFVVIPDGAFINQLNSNNNIINTYSFTTVSQTVSAFTPASGSTNQSPQTDITLAFTSPPLRGTGTITLRRDSAAGTILESYDAATSNRITISGNNWILNPTNNLPEATIFLVIPNGAIIGYLGLNIGGLTYSFGSFAVLGSVFEGGNLVCKASPVRWVVAPSAANVYTTFSNRNTANTCAQDVSGCTGWFVPTCTQLQNPGYTCRQYWNYINTTCCYWSSSLGAPAPGPSPLCPQVCTNIGVNFSNGAAFTTPSPQNIQNSVRSFRCVTY